MAVKKISVSIDAEELEWLRKQARAQKKSLSAVIGEATRLLRQLAARRKLLAEVGEIAALTPKRVREIERDWKA